MQHPSASNDVAGCLTAAADADTDVISVGGADGAGAGYRVKFKHKIPMADVGECLSYGRLLCESVLIIGSRQG